MGWEPYERTGITDVSSHRLRDPIKAVGAEAKSFFVFEFLGGSYQAKRPLLY